MFQGLTPWQNTKLGGAPRSDSLTKHKNWVGHCNPLNLCNTVEMIFDDNLWKPWEITVCEKPCVKPRYRWARTVNDIGPVDIEKKSGTGSAGPEIDRTELHCLWNQRWRTMDEALGYIRTQSQPWWKPWARCTLPPFEQDHLFKIQILGLSETMTLCTENSVVKQISAIENWSHNNSWLWADDAKGMREY